MRKALEDKHWRDFVRWCRTRRLKPLPAHPWTVAAYVRWCEARDTYDGIVKRIRAITRAHLLKAGRLPDRSPIVLRTLRRIEARSHSRPDRAALFPADDFVAPAAPRGGPKARQEGRRKRAGRGLSARPKLVPRRPPQR